MNMNDADLKKIRSDRLRRDRFNEKALRLFRNRSKKKQLQDVRRATSMRNSNIVIAHEDIWWKLIRSNHIAKPTMNYLIDADIILMTEQTRLNIITKFNKLFKYYQNNLNEEIANELKSLVIPSYRLLNLSKQRNEVIAGVRMTLGHNYMGTIPSREETNQIIIEHKNLIEGIASTIAYDNIGAKFVTEDKSSLLISASRKKVYPTIMELVNADIVEIKPILDNIEEINAKSLHLIKPDENKESGVEIITEVQEYFKDLIKSNNILIQKAIEIDEEGKKSIEEDDTVPKNTLEHNYIGIDRSRR